MLWFIVNRDYAHVIPVYQHHDRYSQWEREPSSGHEHDIHMKTRGICTFTGTALRGSDGRIWLALSALSQMDWKTSRSYALAPPLTLTKCEVAICSHTPMSTMGHAMHTSNSVGGTREFTTVGNAATR